MGGEGLDGGGGGGGGGGGMAVAVATNTIETRKSVPPFFRFGVLWLRLGVGPSGFGGSRQLQEGSSCGPPNAWGSGVEGMGRE